MRKRVLIVVVFVLVIVVVVLIFLLKSGREDDLIEANGFVEGEIIDVSSMVSARVSEVLVEEGDVVEVGQPLVRLDLREAGYALDSLASTISSLRARAGEVLTRLNKAEQDLKRAEKLHSGGVISDSALENARVKYDALRSEYSSLIAQIEAQKGSAKRAEVHLEEEVLTAPIDGIVDSVNINEGELAMPGRSLVSIIDHNEKYIRVYISEKDIPKVKVGDEVEIKIDAYPGRTYKGRVSYISSRAEFTPANVQTKRQRITLVFMVKIDILEGFDVMHTGIPADVVFK